MKYKYERIRKRRIVKSREERLLLSGLNRGLLFFFDLSNVFFDGFSFLLQIRQMVF